MLAIDLDRDEPDSALTFAPASGEGSGSVTVRAAANNGAAVRRTVTIGGQALTVELAEAPACQGWFQRPCQEITSKPSSSSVPRTARISSGLTPSVSSSNAIHRRPRRSSAGAIEAPKR